MRPWMTAVLFFLLLIGVWEIIYLAKVVPSIMLPAPVDVLLYYIHAIEDGSLLHASEVTLTRLLYGYAVALLLGIPMGILSARYQIFGNTIGVVALGLQMLPSVCWVPLALLWFGQTEKAMFFIVLMGSLWSISLATETGAKGIPPIYISVARTMGSKGVHTWLHVILPASLPFIISGMKQGWAFAWRSIMAAEIYITILSGFGLGHLLHYGRELHAMDSVIGIMIVIIFIGLMIDSLLFAPLENYIHKRWGTKDTLRRL